MQYFEIWLIFRFPKGLFLLICNQSSIAKSNFTSFVQILLCVCFVAQACPWDFVTPMDCSPPGSSDHGDSPGKNTRVRCHTLL